MPGRKLSTVGVAVAVATSLTIFAGVASADPLERAAAPVSQLAQPRVTAVPGGGTIERYQQRVGGVPVLGGEVVTVDPESRGDMLVSDSTASGLGSVNTSGAISRADAVEAARQAAGVTKLRAPASGKLGIDPAAKRLAWEVTLPSAEPLADLIVTVDARSGEKLRQRDVLSHATGTAAIFNPNPVVLQGSYAKLKDKNDKDYTLLTNLRVPVTLDRLSADNGCLKGQYVDARLGRKGKKVCKPGADYTAVTRSKNEFEAVMAYFHIDRTRAYVDSLGLSEPLRTKPQKVFANAIPDDNSFYSSVTHELVLGTGGVDDGEDADVIVHEYGHSLQDQAAENSLRSREGGTLGEGFGDYMAAAMSNLTTGPSPFDTCIFDWDGISYSPDGTCGRLANIKLDVKKAEKKCGKEIHCVGQIWSSTLFELRTALGNDTNGQSVMDRIVLESNFLNTKKTGFQEAGRGLIAADQLLYAGAHVPTIQSVLTARKFCKATC